MIDTKLLLGEKMVGEELSKSRNHGVKIAIPTRSIIENEAATVPDGSPIQLSETISEFYSKIDLVHIHWFISKRNQPTIDLFQNDPWLKKNYLDDGYDWGVVHEMLSGLINIQKLEDLLNPNYCKEQSFYYSLDYSEDYNAADFVPFDIHWHLTACLKKDSDNNLIDNIWLVYSEDSARPYVYDMQVSVEEYLNLAYQAKGFFYWQFVYMLKEKTEHYELMKRFLPKMLPHVKLDLSEFGIVFA